MRWLLVFLCSCVYTSVDTDGDWSSLEGACVPLDGAQKLVDTKFSIMALPAGSSLLYSGGEDMSQLDLGSRESKVVLRSDALWQFAVFDNDVVYYEGNGDPNNRQAIDLIIDHGARSASRYQRISPRRGFHHAGLITTRNGIYFWTSPTLDPTYGKEGWRWNPESNTVEPFDLRSVSIVRYDDTSFFYFDVDGQLVVRPQVPGPPTLVVQFDPESVLPLPVGIDRDQVYYARYSVEKGVHDLVTIRTSSILEETLAANHYFTTAAMNESHIYFTEDLTDDLGARRENLYRIPRAGGPVETYFDGDQNTQVFDVTLDGCNVYWQQFRFEQGSLYGREITP